MFGSGFRDFRRGPGDELTGAWNRRYFVEQTERRKVATQTFHVDDASFHATITCGVAAFREEGTSYEQPLKRGDNPPNDSCNRGVGRPILRPTCQRRTTMTIRTTLYALPALLLSAGAAAQAEYTRIAMDIDVDRPAEHVWERIGDYCDIEDWLGIDCEITSGDGGIGTVRSLIDGRITEILVAETPLSYGYTQPAVPGEFYNHYHGFLEARPMGENSTRLIYTLMLDQSNLEDDAARQADTQRRRETFENALATMKSMAESE